MTGEFLAQKVSNAEHVSIWWRHHVSNMCVHFLEIIQHEYGYRNISFLEILSDNIAYTLLPPCIWCNYLHYLMRKWQAEINTIEYTSYWYCFTKTYTSSTDISPTTSETLLSSWWSKTVCSRDSDWCIFYCKSVLHGNFVPVCFYFLGISYGDMAQTSLSLCIWCNIWAIMWVSASLQYTKVNIDK